jgi:hypothetical protein
MFDKLFNSLMFFLLFCLVLFFVSSLLTSCSSVPEKPCILQTKDKKMALDCMCYGNTSFPAFCYNQMTKEEVERFR